MDRVHRIVSLNSVAVSPCAQLSLTTNKLYVAFQQGQTRPVRVMRFLMKESIEERLALSLQDAKAALGKGSIEKLSAAERRKARLTCLLDLFQVDMSKLEIDWK
jgi:SNF2 family DNA or RNA helicase